MTNGTSSYDFETAVRDWRDMMLNTWGTMAKATVGSDAFAASSAAMLDWTLAYHKQLRHLTSQMLDALELPKRSDLARISRQVMGAEQRIVEVEERLDSLQSSVDRLATAVERLAEQRAQEPAAASAQPGPAQSAAKPHPASKPAKKHR